MYSNYSKQRKDKRSLKETRQPLAPPKQERPARRKARRAEGNLLPGPPIVGYSIERDEEHHSLTINHRRVRCSRDEYRLLLRLMECYERPVPFDELITLFHGDFHIDQALLKIARRKLTYTLSALRTKLWATDFTITRVVDVGYLLTQREKLWSSTHAFPGETDQGF